MSSSTHRTIEAIPIATPQWARSSDAVPKAVWRKGTSTTRTCRPTPSASAPHSHLLTNRWWKALTVSERAHTVKNNWQKTRVVKAAVRATSRESWPSMSPPGRKMSRVTSMSTPIRTPVVSTSVHIARSMTFSDDVRGRRAMTSSTEGSTPMASAGAESVTRLIQRI